MVLEKRFAKQLPCPLRFLQQLSVPDLGRFSRLNETCFHQSFWGLHVPFISLVNVLIHSRASSDRYFLPSKLKFFPSEACVRISSTCPLSFTYLSKLQRRLQLFIELLLRCYLVQSSSSSASSQGPRQYFRRMGKFFLLVGGDDLGVVM